MQLLALNIYMLILTPCGQYVELMHPQVHNTSNVIL